MSEVMRFYLMTNRLKYLIRSGWKYWNVPLKRLESVAEHIYGTCMLAIGMDSEYGFKINIEKVIKMLVCHEIEEVIIGDYTPFDSITVEEKIKQGRLGVEHVLGNLIKKDEYMFLLDEFNQKKTAEAIFAHYCDKMECDIQAKIYDDICQINYTNAIDKVINDDKIKDIIESGFTNMGDVFIEYDRDLYKDTFFTKFLEELKQTDTTNIGILDNWFL